VLTYSNVYSPENVTLVSFYVTSVLDFEIQTVEI